MGIFKIDVDNFQWINGPEDDPQDLCLHGHVTAWIGDTLLEDDGTVSATALYLLKTLTDDKVMAECDIQMIPCCGHTMFANRELTEVMISGCPNGTDWSTIHEGDSVRLILPSGQEKVVELSAYREEVLRFAEKVKEYIANHPGSHREVITRMLRYFQNEGIVKLFCFHAISAS